MDSFQSFSLVFVLVDFCVKLLMVVVILDLVGFVSQNLAHCFFHWDFPDMRVSAKVKLFVAHSILREDIFGKCDYARVKERFYQRLAHGPPVLERDDDQAEPTKEILKTLMNIARAANVICHLQGHRAGEAAQTLIFVHLVVLLASCYRKQLVGLGGSADGKATDTGYLE